MANPTFIRYFADGAAAPHPPAAPQHWHPDDHPPRGSSACEKLGWLVVGILTVYLVSTAVLWLLTPPPGCRGGAGVSGRHAAVEGAHAGAAADIGIDQLEEVAKRPVPTVVMFYAPWCGHCAKMMPMFLSAAARHGGAVSQVHRVDCGDAGQAALAPYGVQGFPTILRFGPDGAATEFAGPRSEEHLIRFFNGD